MAPGLLDLVHLTTWAVCAVIKLPQLVAVLRAGSAWGLSLSSLLLELAGLTARATPIWSLLAPPKQYESWERIFASLCAVTLFCVSLFSLLVFLRYQIYYGYPLETYLEYPIIIAQDVILIYCIMHFSGKKKRALFYAVIFGGGWYMLTLQKWIIDVAMNLCTLVSAASKLVQLQHLWQAKDSGQVSALTWGMSAYTCATRIITTVMTTNDLAVLIRFIIMLILNIWVTATILHYRKTKKTD